MLGLFSKFDSIRQSNTYTVRYAPYDHLRLFMISTNIYFSIYYQIKIPQDFGYQFNHHLFKLIARMKCDAPRLSDTYDGAFNGI